LKDTRKQEIKNKGFLPILPISSTPNITPTKSLTELRFVNNVAVLAFSPVFSIIVLEKVITDELPKMVIVKS